MADALDHFDDLPKHDAEHVTEGEGRAAFQARLTESGRFHPPAHRPQGLMARTAKMEVVDREQRATSGPRAAQRDRAPASKREWLSQHRISRSQPSTTLPMHPHSFYAAYHIPTASLRICLAETVLYQYEHAGEELDASTSLTVCFTDDS